MFDFPYNSGSEHWLGACLARGVSMAAPTDLNQVPAQPNTASSSLANQANSLHRQMLEQLPINRILKNNFFCLKIRAGFQIPSRYLLKYTVLLLRGVPNSSLAPTPALRPCTEATWLTIPSAAGWGEAQFSVEGGVGLPPFLLPSCWVLFWLGFGGFFERG